jgi:NADH-quinone oxidoreductase subunit C
MENRRMLIDKLKERFGADLVEAESAHGDETIVVARERAADTLRALRDEREFAFDMLTDVTAVDWLGRDPRFEVVYHLNSLGRHHRLRVKVRVGDGPEAWVPSAFPIWRAADWLERECYDMFGIDFRGHPDLRRILLYDSFQGHPLRKDYPYQKRQPIAEEVDPVVNPRQPSR